jgi:hypothetical protein
MEDTISTFDLLPYFGVVGFLIAAGAGIGFAIAAIVAAIRA